jgi:lysozyme
MKSSWIVLRQLIVFECSGDVKKYLKAYKCPSGVWTIGIGTTVYPSGKRVKSGDVITEANAYWYVNHHIEPIEKYLSDLLGNKINQNMFDALVLFVYNVGINQAKLSTLFQKVLKNPNDLNISLEFKRWIWSNGIILKGLIERRRYEANLYFSPINKNV